MGRSDNCKWSCANTQHWWTSTIRQKQPDRRRKEKCNCIINFLTEKRDGTIKVRQCKDGRKQQDNMLKDNLAFFTMWTEWIFITRVINANENREVTVVDFQGAFLHVDNDQDVIMFMKRRLVELMTLVASQTDQIYVMIEKRGKVFFVKVQKVLYGMLKSMILFSKKIRGDLDSAGFGINPYDPCVVNKWISLSQKTMIWHVGDSKISHQYGWAITKVMK